MRKRFPRIFPLKFKTPDFLENVENPVAGELALRSHYPESVIVGIDEVGRGPLAGPVVACAAVLRNPEMTHGLNDSKKLTKVKREAIFESVKEACLCYAIASASVEEIDSMNILAANFLAMRRALTALGFKGLSAPLAEIPVEYAGAFPESRTLLLAVDGNLKIAGVSPELQLPIIKGDGRIASISAASILAKVYRDRFMEILAEKYPGYGFEIHAGYGTKSHLEAIRKLGLSPAHRKSFHPKALQVELF